MLFTYRLIPDGHYATFAGPTEPAAFRRAYEYHGRSVVARELLHHVCRCESKDANAVREDGYLICARPECAGVIL